MINPFSCEPYPKSVQERLEALDDYFCSAIYAYIDQNGGATLEELEKEFNPDHDRFISVQYALDDLYDAGLIEELDIYWQTTSP